MPLYETSCQVVLPQVEAIPFDVGDSYPFPRLSLIDAPPQEQEVRVIVLENQYLTVAILPDLGGRIILNFDGRSLPIALVKGGKRGVAMQGGVELSLDGGECLNAMGQVEYRLLDDDEEPAVLIGDLASGLGISWYMRLSLPTHRAALRVDAQVFNRELVPCTYKGGFLGMEGIVLGALAGTFIGDFRTSTTTTLSPRQTDSWSCDLIPTVLPGKKYANSNAIVSWDGQYLNVLALEEMPAHKVVLLCGGKSLETTADFVAGRSASFQLDGLALEAVALLGPRGTMLSWDLSKAETATYEQAFEQGDLVGFRRELLNADSRGAAYVGLAMGAIRDQDSITALEHLEDAIGVNANDALAWWLKAAILRRAGQDNENELLNAHYLAPFEPMLRAESYLAAPNQEKSPSSLLKPLMQDPDAAIEVATRLHEAGLLEDLSQWVDECLRHREVPMLRYLVADALLNNSRMQTEAAAHVQSVAKSPINPPYPWRRGEIRVLQRLRRAFPMDARLEELLRVAPQIPIPHEVAND